MIGFEQARAAKYFNNTFSVCVCAFDDHLGKIITDTREKENDHSKQFRKKKSYNCEFVHFLLYISIEFVSIVYLLLMRNACVLLSFYYVSIYNANQ